VKLKLALSVTQILCSTGLPKEQKDLFGLMSAEKYFYLNQVTPENPMCPEFGNVQTVS
jgi:hypothetical protein